MRFFTFKPQHTITLLLLFSNACYGYYLDHSCEKDKEIVTRCIKGAFDMADAALDVIAALEQPPETVPEEMQTPVYRAQVELINNILRAATKSGTIDKQANRWNELKTRFELVKEFNNTREPPPWPGNPTRSDPFHLRGAQYENTGVRDILFFCDHERYKGWEGYDCNGKRDDEKVCDTAMNVEDPYDDLYVRCRDSMLRDTKTGAITDTRWHPGQPAKIQLCPGQLAQMRKLGDKQVLEDLRGALTLASPRLMEAITSPSSTVRLIDFACLGDCLILHEMTHALKFPFLTKDVDGWGSYKWNNLVRLSDNLGRDNAETYAYFGLVSQLILPRNKGKEPMGVEKSGLVYKLKMLKSGDVSNAAQASGPLRVANSTEAAKSANSTEPREPTRP
ncbi:hypothetical protein QQS21_005143 [Conoideocrella luteorostrata]|uniref:Uncharacterized protein n=1 Tax=Conoideocrella luteorostrata TaxID=1105319 RepID=A0AAJ0CU91_9HYPO|nr:hypothetical protein QQS21_005143 [Conoideocrella luteorostrata]